MVTSVPVQQVLACRARPASWPLERAGTLLLLKGRPETQGSWLLSGSRSGAQGPSSLASCLPTPAGSAVSGPHSASADPPGLGRVQSRRAEEVGDAAGEGAEQAALIGFGEADTLST